jgi:hypothetical protein
MDKFCDIYFNVGRFMILKIRVGEANSLWTEIIDVRIFIL